MTELQKAYSKAEAFVSDNEYAIYKINDTHTIAQENGYFVVMTMDGEIVEKSVFLILKNIREINLTRLRELLVVAFNDRSCCGAYMG